MTAKKPARLQRESKSQPARVVVAKPLSLKEAQELKKTLTKRLGELSTKKGTYHICKSLQLCIANISIYEAGKLPSKLTRTP